MPRWKGRCYLNFKTRPYGNRNEFQLGKRSGDESFTNSMLKLKSEVRKVKWGPERFPRHLFFFTASLPQPSHLQLKISGECLKHPRQITLIVSSCQPVSRICHTSCDSRYSSLSQKTNVNPASSRSIEKATSYTRKPRLLHSYTSAANREMSY